MALWIIVPWYEISAQPSLLGELKKYEKGHLKYYAMIKNQENVR